MTISNDDRKLSRHLVSGLPIFVLTGGFAALCNLLARAALSLVIPFPAAVVLAYMLGMVVAFTLFRLFVFKPSGGRMTSQAARFVGVNLIALAQVFAISLLLARIVLPGLGFTWHAEAVAHFIGVCCPIFSSYVLHKHFTFKG